MANPARLNTSGHWVHTPSARAGWGLTPGVEYWASSGAVVLYSALAAETWTRRVGLALSPTQLLVDLGDVLQTPAE